MVRDAGANGNDSRLTAAEVVAKYRDSLVPGQTFLVTGATGGIGYETARVLATLVPDSRVLLVGRSMRKAEQAKRELGQLSNVEPLACDFGNQIQVRDLAEELHERQQHVDVLILNAGVLETSRRRAVDDTGMELHMAVNHVNQALLVNLLMQQAGGLQRIVFVSSSTHVVADPSQFLTPEMVPPPVSDEEYGLSQSFTLYGNSKMAQIMMARELHERYHGHRRGGPYNVTAVSLDPGGILTNIQRTLAPWALDDSVLLEVGRWLLVHTFMKTVEQGAATTVYCAIAPDVVSGHYYINSHQTVSGREEDLVQNATARKLLWTFTNYHIAEHGEPWP